jgi:hypothetical protein
MALVHTEGIEMMDMLVPVYVVGALFFLLPAVLLLSLVVGYLLLRVSNLQEDLDALTKKVDAARESKEQEDGRDSG